MSADGTVQTAGTARIVETSLIRSLVRFFEYEHFHLVSANLPEPIYTKPVIVDDFMPDIIATDTRGATVYGVALGCATLQSLDVTGSILALADKGPVYLIVPEACGETARAMKETTFAHNNVNLLFI